MLDSRQKMQVVGCGHDVVIGAAIQDVLHDMFGDDYDCKFIITNRASCNMLVLDDPEAAATRCVEMIALACRDCSTDDDENREPDLTISMCDCLMNGCYMIVCAVRDESGAVYVNQSASVILSEGSSKTLQYLNSKVMSDESSVFIIAPPNCDIVIDAQDDLIEQLTFGDVSGYDLCYQTLLASLTGVVPIDFSEYDDSLGDEDDDY